MDQLRYELIQNCTVKLVLPDKSDWGTGFFVAKATILTCAHVVAGYEDQLITVQWREHKLLKAKVLQSLPEPIDLALLQCTELSLLMEHPPCVVMDKDFQPFHKLYIYGYPDDFPQGAGVTVQCEGDATDQGIRLIKFQAGQIRPGHSGAPVLNKETGKVCGLVSNTRGRSTDWGGLAISVAEVVKHFSELELKNRQFHECLEQKRPQGEIINPFESQKALDALSYYSGREELLRQLFEELDKGSNRSLVGESRVGKTWLLRQICQSGHTKMKRRIDGFVYLDMRCIEDGKDFFEALCSELNINPPMRGYKLQRLLKGKQYILCLDEIDQLADDQRFTKNERDQLYSLCDGKDVPFSLVIASQIPLNQLFPDSPTRSSPLIGICRQIDVKPLSLPQVKAFLTNCMKETYVQFNEVQIKQLYLSSEGKPEQLLELAAKQYLEIGNKGI